MRGAVLLLGLVLAGLITGPVRASDETITINGVKRSYSLEVPTRRPAPVVIVLHGNTQQLSLIHI